VATLFVGVPAKAPASAGLLTGDKMS
jgi:hypothetical protein